MDELRLIKHVSDPVGSGCVRIFWGASVRAAHFQGSMGRPFQHGTPLPPGQIFQAPTATAHGTGRKPSLAGGQHCPLGLRDQAEFAQGPNQQAGGWGWAGVASGDASGRCVWVASLWRIWSRLLRKCVFSRYPAAGAILVGGSWPKHGLVSQ